MTRQAGSGVTIIEEAESTGQKICAHPCTKTDLNCAWPTANFVFDLSGKEHIGMLDLYENGKCDMLAISW